MAHTSTLSPRVDPSLVGDGTRDNPNLFELSSSSSSSSRTANTALTVCQAVLIYRVGQLLEQLTKSECGLWVRL